MRPLSGNQLKKLGDRLAAKDRATAADHALLAEVASAYQVVLNGVEERLRSLGRQVTARVKTTGTLIDKLRRETGIKLPSIHDFAGARIVVEGGLIEQDQVIDRILAEFSDSSRAPIKKDRRENPSYGYRAMHVIVFMDGVPVEIQVRTELQNSWAQLTERLGDTWGRGLRYGEGPDEPDAPSGMGTHDELTRAQLIERLGHVSVLVARVEVTYAKVQGISYQIANAPGADRLVLGQMQAVRECDDAADALADYLGRLRAAAKDPGDSS
jgi:hypothetical protein